MTNMSMMNNKGKFSFWTKRVVFAGGEAMAETAIQYAIKEALNQENAKLQVDNLTQVAKDSLPKESSPDRDEAEKLIDAARGRFEQALQSISQRTAYKVAYEGLKTDGLTSESALQDAKVKLAALETAKAALVGYDEGLQDFGAKQTEAASAAVAYYEGLAKFDANTVGGDADKEKYQRLMARAGEMQQRMNQEMTLVPADKMESIRGKYKQAVADMLAFLGQQKDLSPEEQASLKRFDFAVTNLDAAKEAGHKAGAQEYMSMVVAEQEARSVWLQLPQDKDWRLGDINKPLAPDQPNWDANGDNYKNYQAAVAAFQEAMTLSVNKTAGDSIKAAELFKKSADLFKLVAASYESKKVEEKPDDKIAAENAKTAVEQYFAANVKNNGNGVIEALYNDSKTAADKLFGEEKFKEAKSAYDDLKKTLEGESLQVEKQQKDVDEARLLAGDAKAFFDTKKSTFEGRGNAVEALIKALPVDNVSPDVAFTNWRERTRIYNEAATAIDAENSAWVQINAFRSPENGGTVDFTANAIWEDANRRFNHGDFASAAKKFGDVAKIYEHMIKNPNDRSKSMRPDENGNVVEATKAESDAKKAEADAAKSHTPDIDFLTQAHVKDADAAERDGYYAHAVDQYTEIIRLCSLAEAAKTVKDKAAVGAAHPDVGNLIGIGDEYYKGGNFDAAKYYYSKANELQDRLANPPLMAVNNENVTQNRPG